MHLWNLILWNFLAVLGQTTFAATILNVQKVEIAGAHGLAVISQDHFIFADTFKSMGFEASALFEVKGSKSTALPFRGMGLSGITPIPGGYLICDLYASVVFKTDEEFQVLKQWNVENPWLAKADRNGGIFVLTHGGQFSSLLPDGTTRILISNLDAPFDFEFTENSGEVWISEQGIEDGRVSLWQKGDSQKYNRVLDSKFDWKNPEGLLYREGVLWALDTELGLLVQVKKNGETEVALKDLGIPILIKAIDEDIVIYSNHFEGGPALITVRVE